jgi:hypothetical protein
MTTVATPLSVAQPFSYIITSPTLAAASSGSFTLIFGQDSEFDLQAILASTNQDTNNVTILNNFTLLMRDVTGGRDYSTAPVPRYLLAGVAPVNVNNEGRAIRIPRKQQIEFQFTNTSASSLIVTLALKGYKVFVREL